MGNQLCACGSTPEETTSTTTPDDESAKPAHAPSTTPSKAAALRGLVLPATKFISGGGDNLIIISDLTTGRVLRQLAGQKGHVKSLAVNLAGDRIVSGSGQDAFIRVWDPATGYQLAGLQGPPVIPSFGFQMSLQLRLPSPSLHPQILCVYHSYPNIGAYVTA